MTNLENQEERAAEAAEEDARVAAEKALREDFSVTLRFLQEAHGARDASTPRAVVAVQSATVHWGRRRTCTAVRATVVQNDGDQVDVRASIENYSDVDGPPSEDEYEYEVLS
jgi:hypothetical protein